MSASVHSQPKSSGIVYSNDEDNVIDILSSMRYNIVSSQKGLLRGNGNSMPNSPRRESLGSHSSNSSFNSYYSSGNSINASFYSGSYDGYKEAPKYLLTLAHHAVEENVNTAIQNHFDKSFRLLNLTKGKSCNNSNEKMNDDDESDNTFQIDDLNKNCETKNRPKPILKSTSEPNLSLSNTSLTVCDVIPLQRRNLPTSFWNPTFNRSIRRFSQ